ncbi:hypothetical protein HELRODRAFT_94672 [Helobdella robusta]|uniref:DNA repair and recombination protein RAD54B n=1 Tax=Helobdella robusta TaxID=6412 RepID=T1G922_HELRO|nr:hypothetical protein HELRODRAFT_94672 [Helobdella robusta]ESO02595.1 hypothetical protein HELRODRAFT_94672 [Helobdella robusta]
MWRKVSKKKCKRWEGDAILSVTRGGLKLLDVDGKCIGSSMSYKAHQLSSLKEGQTLVIGQKEVEVLSVISEEDFLKGRCFKPSNDDLIDIQNDIKKEKKRERRRENTKTSIRTSIKPNSQSQSPPVGAYILPRPSDSHQVVAFYHNPSGLPVADVYVDAFLCKFLRQHQKDGVAFLYKCILGMNRSRDDGQQSMVGGAILADEMGLGKTLQCISLIWTLYKQGPYGGKPVLRKVLIVVPGSLVKNWYKEFKKWVTLERMPVYIVSADNEVKNFIHLTSHPVLIISYDKLVRDINELKRIKFDLVICDEGHKLKNSRIKTTQCISSLDIKRRIVLTGTPLQNDLHELFSLVDFCSPGALGTITTFKHVYEQPILASRLPTASVVELNLGQNRAHELNRVTGQLILRRTQEINNKFLPPKVDIVLICSLTPLQLTLYNKLVTSIKSCVSHFEQPASSSSSSSSSSCLAKHFTCISALKSVCNHPDLIHEKFQSDKSGGRGYDNKEEELCSSDLLNGLQAFYPKDYKYMSAENKCMFSSKMLVLHTMLKMFKRRNGDDEGNDDDGNVGIGCPEKVVVVSNYTKTLDLIEKLCKCNNYKFLRLDGSLPTSKRQEVVDRFNNPAIRDFIFLLSTKAGGFGLNLVGASRLILYDIDWNPAIDLQAMARVWRDGQRHRTYIYRLLTTNTIEERMFQRQISKRSLSGVVVDSKSVDSKYLPQFSKEQLMELFSPVPVSLFDTNIHSNLHKNSSCSSSSGSSGGGSDGGVSLSITHDMLNCKKCHKVLNVNTTATNNYSIISKNYDDNNDDDDDVDYNLVIDINDDNDDNCYNDDDDEDIGDDLPTD